MGTDQTEKKGEARKRVAWLLLLRLLPRVSVLMTVGLAVLSLVSFILSPAFTIATARLVAATAGALDARGFDARETAWQALALAMGIFIAQQIITSINGLLVDRFARRIDDYVRQRIMTASLRPIGIAHLEDPDVLDHLRNAQGIGSGFYTPGLALKGLMGTSQSRLSTIAHAVLVGQYFHWWLAVALIVAGVFQKSKVMGWFLETLKVATQRASALRRAEYELEVGLGPEAAKEVRVFGLPSWILQRFRSQWLAAIEPIWRERRRQVSRVLPPSLPMMAIHIGGLALIALAASGGDIDLESFVVLIGAVTAAAGMQLSQNDHYLAYGTEALPSVQALENAAGRVGQTFGGTEDPEGLPRDAIRFEDVSFRYPGQTRDVLDSLDLVIRAGMSLAIVGPNGAGKTTLVKLLARLYEPSSGRITVDGIPLSRFDPQKWQARIAAIFQDYVRYELSAADNVGLGAVSRLGDLAALETAAKRAGAMDIIQRLPHGWKTVLSREYAEGGELSGGQWQRIALARALFAVHAGAGVLVLDEPTANLDVRAEAEIFDRFLDLTAGLTTILVSHRFSTVRRAQQICVLEDGRITELGTHQELIASHGRYSEMFTLQASRFVES